jgi:hypothetical protein
MANKLSNDERIAQLESVVWQLLLFLDSELRQAAGLTLDEVRLNLKRGAGLDAPPPLTRREREDHLNLVRELMARAERVCDVGRQLSEMSRPR